MKRIALIGPYPPPYGGISIFMDRLYQLIQKELENECHIVNEFGDKNESVKYALSSNSRIMYLIKLGYFIFAHSHRYHIIYYNGPHTLTRYVLVLFAKVFGYKLIVHIHGQSLIRASKSIWGRIMAKSVLRNSNKVLTVNSLMVKQMQDLFYREDYQYLPAHIQSGKMNVPEEVQKFLRTLNDGKTYFLSYGTLDKTDSGNYVYGIKEIFSFFSSKRVKDLGYHLIFVLILYKDKHFVEYQNEIASLVNQQDNLHIFINKGGKYPLVPFFAKVNGYIRWTMEDGLGVSLIEAMENGIPAFATNVCNRPEGTVLFSPEDENQLLKGIQLNSFSGSKEYNFKDYSSQYIELLNSTFQP